MLTRYTAGWREIPLPGHHGAAGAWMPEPWTTAVTRLAQELERNLNAWAGVEPGAADKYRAALDALRAARLDGRGERPLMFVLPRHALYVSEA